jgi:2'-5' RNA ligase
MKRVIYVEPIIEEGDTVDELFRKYNPDSKFVNSHICLVFPFESNLVSEEINEIFMSTLYDLESFDIKLSGLEISYEENNNFLFLNVIDEFGILRQMSFALYNELGNNAKLKGIYKPHITIGKSRTINEIKKMENDASILSTLVLNAKINKIYSKIMNKDDNGNAYLIDELEIYLDDKKEHNIKK